MFRTTPFGPSSKPESETRRDLNRIVGEPANVKWRAIGERNVAGSKMNYRVPDIETKEGMPRGINFHDSSRIKGHISEVSVIRSPNCLFRQGVDLEPGAKFRINPQASAANATA